jgi:hypothetical protein
VPSLLDAMIDGREYESIVSCPVSPSHDFVVDLRRAAADVEAVRGRPCLVYMANLIKPLPQTAIEQADFQVVLECLRSIAPRGRALDVMIATPGGSVHTIAQIVEATRSLFDDVEFIIPAQSMSAGTLWALSGDAIWMSEHAYLGPIDPQVQTRDGRVIPAQALIELLRTIEEAGAARLTQGLQPEWSHVVLLKNMDQKELGAAMSMSRYVGDLAAQFIEQYKFRRWTTKETSGNEVTDIERKQRAQQIARELCSHARWKAHGHAINRRVLQDELRLRILHPESIPGFDRAIRRFWGLWHYLMDKTVVVKMVLAQDFLFIRKSAGNQG